MKIIIEIEIEGDEQGAIDAIENAMDAGAIQDAIRDADLEELDWQITDISRRLA